jgi:hypothetical protein
MHTQTHLTQRAARWAAHRWLAVAMLAGSSGWGPSLAATEAAPPTPTLALQIEGQGAVVSADHLLCNGPTCSTAIAQGTVVQLTATPASGWRFAGWGGACSGRMPQCMVTMAGALTASARFIADYAPVGCAVPPGKVGATPVIAATHPKVLLNHALTVSCLKAQIKSREETYRRFREFVDTELAGGVAQFKQFGYQEWFAALVWQLTGYPEYRDFAVARIDQFVHAEEARIASGQPAMVAFDSYLYAGNRLGGVALVYDWCFDSLSATQKARWIAYMNQGVYNVWHERDAQWGGKAFPWTGWANTDPYNNYHYSFLQATMLVGLATAGDNPQAATWLKLFREDKIKQSLVPQFNRMLYSGGSLEGTTYGVALKELFKVYDWWDRSTGERIADLTPHTLGSLAWGLHQVVPTTESVVNLGDQSRDHNAPFFDYNREYILSLMALYPHERLSSAAKQMLQASTLPAMAYGMGSVWDFIYKPPALPEARLTDLSTSWYGVGTGDVFMRAAWADPTSAFASFKCGWLVESHQHYDQGAFQIYRGEWLAPTANRFTRNGLDPSIDSNNMAWFRDPGTGEPIHQTTRNGGESTCQMLAVAEHPLYTYAAARITPVYHANPLIVAQEREFVFIKPGTFVVFDRMTASSAKVQRVWSVHLSTPPAEVAGDRLTYVGERGNRMDVFRVAPTGLRYNVAPQRFASTFQDVAQYPNPRRVDATDTSGGNSSLFLHVIATTAAGGASSVRAVAAASPATGQTGVRIELADGRVATLRFANAQPGGNLEITSASGTVLSSGALPNTVTAPPLFKP